VTDEPMVERLEPTWERRDDGSVYINTHPGGHTAHGAELWLIDRVDALLSQLREQRDRTSFWETLHDERVESLETERDTWRARAEALSTTYTTGGCNCSSRKDCPVHAPMYVAPPPPPLRKPDTENGR